MDAAYAFECHAWDQATHDFSRWLNGTRPVLHAAVRDITGWPEDKLADLKNVYPRNIRAIRDEHELALQQITESDS